MIDRFNEIIAIVRQSPRNLEAAVDRAGDPAGESFVDITEAGFTTQVSYRPSVGFGSFVDSFAFGRPDAFVRDVASAAARAIEAMPKRSVAAA